MNSWVSFTLTKIFKRTLHLSASPHLNKGEQIIFSLIPLLHHVLSPPPGTEALGTVTPVG